MTPPAQPPPSKEARQLASDISRGVPDGYDVYCRVVRWRQMTGEELAKAIDDLIRAQVETSTKALQALADYESEVAESRGNDLATLRTQLVEAQKDKTRLDWMEAQEGHSLETLHLSRCNGSMGTSWFKKNIRAAIDGAMKGTA